MAKNMASLDSENIVTNILWCNDDASETKTIKDTGEYLVKIGDVYENGKWYREGAELLTPLENAYIQIADTQKALSVLGVEIE